MSDFLSDLEHHGWERSASAWIRRMQAGTKNRNLLLDPCIYSLLHPLDGLHVLDVGCGEGRLSRGMADLGATVVGLDKTLPLIKHAFSLNTTVSWIRGAAECLPFRDCSFDIGVACLVLMDVADLSSSVCEMSRVVRAGGRLLVVILSPLYTAGYREGSLGWQLNPGGEKTGWLIDRYSERRSEPIQWDGISIVNFHRPLEAYMGAFLGNGLKLLHFSEPSEIEQPESEPEFASDLRRVPPFLVMLWER